MFTIRRIFDDILPSNRAALSKVRSLLAQQFPGLSEAEIEPVFARLRDPFPERFRPIIYVAERRHEVGGFAVLLLDPLLSFALLEYIATDLRSTSSGYGAALYQRVRDDARLFGAKGLFFECLPDDPREVDDPTTLKQNRARLRFYERLGARPLINIGYELPISEGQRGLPYLVYDGLDEAPLRPPFVKEVVRAICERKYAAICSPAYVDAVLACVVDDPIKVRPPHYGGDKPLKAPGNLAPISVVVNDKHEIHHVRERGYVESPVRISTILEAFRKAEVSFRLTPPKSHGLAPIRAVHDADFVDYLRRVCKLVGDKKPVYPYVFPIRNKARPPKDLAVRAGYYCIDTFTPLNQNAYLAAVRAVDCTLTAADLLVSGERLTYSLVRPPGHHAERNLFGGFCYFNNNAIAAHRLSKLGKVAILDIDYHHGNGQQSIFYERDDVLTVSLHGHPNFAYPYFSGFDDEQGEGRGLGYNLNFALPEALDGAGYRKALEHAIDAIKAFDPLFLVVALGLDTAKADPTGTWSLGRDDFAQNGRMIGRLGKPTLVVQEGGYRTKTLGTNAASFLIGLAEQTRSNL